MSKTGDQIQKFRKERALTQEALALKLGVTEGAVSKWETGASMPDVEMLCSLADFFHVTVDKLLGHNTKESFIICDDAAFMRMMLDKLLRDRGYSSIGVENGEQLYEQIREQKPYGVFLDIYLTEENGLEILKKLKKKFPQVKVVIVTVDAAEATYQRAMEYGADFFILKPFAVSKVDEALQWIMPAAVNDTAR